MRDLDEALERFHLCGFEYGANALPNYGPMAAEALIALGHAALVDGLIDVLAPRLPACPRGEVIAASERRERLGAPDAMGDWLSTFEAELAGAAWRGVLEREVAVLADGLDARSIHALVRVAHAVRALEGDESPARIRELAFGLAFWAGRHSSAAAGAAERENEVATSASAELSRLARDGAEIYLQVPHDRARNTIAVLAPDAVRTLSPHLAPATRARLERAISRWDRYSEVAAAASRRIELVEDDEVERCARNLEEIRYRAACSLQEHAIPFVAACLREDALEASPILRRAAADAALRLSPAGYQEWR